MPELVLPTEIPWQTLRSKDLEECLYWLSEAMGAKDIQWRLGGKGDGAPDGGRDIECSFYASDPAGEMIRQKWWIESKGRGSTVEPDAVKTAIFNAAAVPDLDVLVIATNSLFSNPTRDWVKEWCSAHPRQAVRLWDRTTLEQLISRHPQVVIRLFPHALTVDGKLEVVRSRFWNYCTYADEPTLKVLWQHRRDLAWDDETMIAVLASEVANGNVADRSWPLLLPEEKLLSVLGNSLANAMYFCLRAERGGISQEPYLEAASYLTLLSLDKFQSDNVATLFREVWDRVGPLTLPQPARDQVTECVVERLGGELRDACTADCSRVSVDAVSLSEAARASYWGRLKLETGDASDEKVEKPGHVLVIEFSDNPCNLGFALDKEHRCPIVNRDGGNRDLEETFATFSEVIEARMAYEEERSRPGRSASTPKTEPH